MATYASQVFDGSAETLDGNIYNACEFRNCTITYNGGTLPYFNDCVFAGCQWHFGDAAQRTITLMANLYQAGDDGKQLIEKTFDRIRGGR